MRFERYCIPLLLLSVAGCDQFVKKSSEVDQGINVPSASEQIANQQQEAKAQSMRKTLMAGDQRFTIISEGDGTLRSLKVAAVNMKGDTTKVDSLELHDIKGFLKDAATADLDKDGNPEIYCFTESKGGEISGSVYAVAYVHGEGVNIKPGTVNNVDLKGYKGQDSFYIQPPYLVRSYPVFEGDNPTSSKKQVMKYALRKHNGEYILTEIK